MGLHAVVPRQTVKSERRVDRIPLLLGVWFRFYRLTRCAEVRLNRRASRSVAILTSPGAKSAIDLNTVAFLLASIGRCTDAHLA